MSRKALVVTTSVAEHILRDSRIMKEVPAFRSIKAHFAIAPKRQCCGQKNKAMHNSMPALKATILALPPAALGKLKELLSVDTLILNFDVNGQVVKKEV